ncbi:MAG TPA: hypothetical protein VH835_08990, partial [Dongiaceae bacterium]
MPAHFWHKAERRAGDAGGKTWISRDGMTQQDRQAETRAATAIIVGSTDRTAFSLDQAARWQRAFARAGVHELHRDTDASPGEGNAILVRADLILEEVLT